jgi:hypothetical protein
MATASPLRRPALARRRGRFLILAAACATLLALGPLAVRDDALAAPALPASARTPFLEVLAADGLTPPRSAGGSPPASPGSAARCEPPPGEFELRYGGLEPAELERALAQIQSRYGEERRRCVAEAFERDGVETLVLDPDRPGRLAARRAKLAAEPASFVVERWSARSGRTRIELALVRRADHPELFGLGDELRWLRSRFESAERRAP